MHPGHPWVWILCAFACVGAAASAQETPALQVKGIVSTAGWQAAVLQTASPDRYSILGKGQREGDVEVRGIDPAAGRVQVSRAGEDSELKFVGEGQGGSLPVGAVPGLRLEQVGLDPVLSIYQQLTGRTLIRVSSLPALQLDLVTAVASDFDLAKAIEGALAGKGVLLRPDRDKFVLAATREQDFDKVGPQLWDLATSLAPAPGSKGSDEVLTAGLINFSGTDLRQVLQIFQELAGRTLLSATTLPSPPIKLKTAGPMTRAEAIYSFVALLALNGISTVSADKDFLLLFPTVQSTRVAALLKRSAAQTPATSVAATPIPAGALNLTFATVQQAATLYSRLAGQSVEVGPLSPRLRLSLKSQTPLSADSALYGLNLLLGLNGLAVEPKEPGPGLVIVPSRD